MPIIEEPGPIEDPGPLESRFRAFGILLPRPFIAITPRQLGRFVRQVIEKLELLQANAERNRAEMGKLISMNERLARDLNEARTTAEAARRQMRRDRNG